MGKHAPDKVKLLYICGAARSGSTLLGLTLQQLPRFFHVGELYHVWTRGFLSDELCSCGIEFKSCPFWSQVIEKAFGNIQNINAEEIKEEMRFVQRIRRFPQIFIPVLRDPEFSRRLLNVSERLTSLYQAIQAVSGCQVIVDSSKSPLYALLLSNIPSVEIHTIHLIRDSRAVAYSWQRKKNRHQPGSSRQELAIQGSLQSAWSWNFANAFSQLLRFASVRYHRFRYEDFAEDPQKNLDRMLSSFYENVPQELWSNGIASSARGHAMGGNPMRFGNNSIKITLDDEWKKSMARKERFIATANTFPLLLFYGYRF